MGIVCGAGILSGKEIMALELAEGLRSAGWPIEIVTSRWGNGDFAHRLEDRHFPVQRIWLGFISATLSLECMRMTAHQALHWPELLLSYRRFLRRAGPERVIHTNWHHLLLLWPFLKPDRDFFWLHEVIPDKPQYRRVFRFLEKRLHCFVPVSRAVARSLAEIGIASDKIRIIYNGIKNPVPANAPQTTVHDRLRVGIIGQVGPWKGHEDLLEAFAMVAKLHPTAELRVFGRGSTKYENQLKQRAAGLGIAEQTTWHGQVADRAEIYRELSVCAVPSRSHDPLPTVAIEAAFFGLPVVASNRGGLPEIVEDGVTGFLVEAEHPQQLAARLDELMNSAELRNRMGRAARRRAETHFSRERFVEDFRRVLGGNK